MAIFLNQIKLFYFEVRQLVQVILDKLKSGKYSSILMCIKYLILTLLSSRTKETKRNKIVFSSSSKYFTPPSFFDTRFLGVRTNLTNPTHLNSETNDRKKISTPIFVMLLVLLVVYVNTYKGNQEK